MFFILFGATGFAQETGTLFGRITDTNHRAIARPTVYIVELRESVSADDSGYFKIELPANKKLTIEINHVSFNSKSAVVKLETGEKKELNFSLKNKVLTTTTVVIEGDKRNRGETKINAKHLKNFISAGGDATDIIKTLPGVSGNNELSSQYSVRGGNFDENLIYVNGIEVFRPMLVRAGEQEGLSFVNGDMVDNLNFYAGGFEARFGDKMSSVLDITYKKPDSAASSLNLSLLGFRAHTEGTFKNKGSYLFGIRQKANSYLLNTTETKGAYKPMFVDFQSYITYPLSKNWEISFLGNAAYNQFISIPQKRETRFGGINDAFQMTVDFDGKENDVFQSYFGAVSLEFKPNYRYKSKFTLSAFNSYEQVSFDILGYYALNSLETDLGSTDFGQVAFNLGVGGFHNHTRSKLNSTIVNAEWNTEYKVSNGAWLTGLKVQNEMVDASYKEWQRIDSAGFNIQQSATDIIFPVLIQSNNSLNTIRYSGFLQRNWNVINNKKTGRELNIYSGVRANYWDYNQQLVVSPRLSVSFTPSNKLNDSLRFSYRAYVGVYQQPPFYKELRNLQFQLQSGVMAQTSVQYGLSMNTYFYMWKRPFKLSTEAYYKDLYNLIPYNVDQVQITYYGKNDARGYATGLEARLNGEFVKGLESWLSVTYMKAMENLNSDYYYRYFNNNGEELYTGYATNNVATDSLKVNPGYMPRPTDQRVAVNVFFQDEIPRFPAFKLHLTLSYGTGYPFGVPNSVRFRNTLRIPDYRRVDIGFSYEMIKDNKLRKGKKLVDISETSFLRFFNDLAFRAEVFNLLDIDNTVSYTWIKDVSNTSYAVPNHLTKLLLNFRILARF